MDVNNQNLANHCRDEDRIAFDRFEEKSHDKDAQHNGVKQRTNEVDRLNEVFKQV